MDFYDYVEPSVRDETVRARLISRIENLLGPKNAALTGKSTVQCFGSFPAKLYLPTADMDLVLVSNQHRNGGLSTLGSKSAVSRVLWASARKLERAGITIKASVIARAKVPIIKFVDRESGINVDLSFENLSGVVAQETFRKWTGEMPHMFPMVALIKQFLVMRGLSDVHYGGIGGFSIICLVYTYLRANKPSNSQDEIVNLANVFMGFLDFWGNKFDLTTQRLEMTSDPPKLVPKVSSPVYSFRCYIQDAVTNCFAARTRH
jgi:non-canonical poly(A) RNA polymerase PAPD5/7